MVGTPNRGSFASVEVLQGINSNVVTVDKLDPFHDADFLTQNVFSSFPSIYELLPRPEVYSRIDLFDQSQWPTGNWHPPAKRLADAQKAWEGLVDDDPRLHLIAGFGMKTVTDLSYAVGRTKFEYHPTTDGDGTVPLQMCLLPALTSDRTWYTESTHTGLLRSEKVADAVGDILQSGKTRELEQTAVRSAGSGTSESFSRSFRPLTWEDFVDDPHRPDLFGNRSGAGIAPGDLPLILEAALSFSSLPADETLKQLRAERTNANPSTGGALSAPRAVSGDRLTTGITFNQTVITRDHQSHLELELFNGNLFDVPFRALVVGIFRNVDPIGPARQLDILTGGAVTELIKRRMFDAEAGKIFVMPSGRSALKADYVVFAGMGDYDTFAQNSASVIRTISCNVLRTLMNCGVDEFATLVYGSNSGHTIRGSVESLVQGYLDALTAIGANENSVQFRRVALVEYDQRKYAELKDEVYRLGGSELCNDIRLRLHEARYPAAAGQFADAMKPDAERRLQRQPDSVVYLAVRMEPPREDSPDWVCHASFLGSKSKAAVFPSVNAFSRSELNKLLEKLPNDRHGMSSAVMRKTGNSLRDLLFSRDFNTLLDGSLTAGDHLAVVTDAESSRIPWEIVPLVSVNASETSASNGGSEISQYPCLTEGVSRRFLTEGTNSLAKYMEERQRAEILEVLLIVNPTNDLPGAEAEGQQIQQVLAGLELVRTTTLRGDLATKSAVLRQLASGRFDVVHYAGHAFFDPENRNQCGLLCANPGRTPRYEVLTGPELGQLPHLPSLVFFNACESGRTRMRPMLRTGEPPTDAQKSDPDLQDRNDRSAVQVSVCEALLRAGITQFIGTYWPVGDSPAMTFAEVFYRKLMEGLTVRQAVLQGRQAIKDNIDANNYIHYGDPAFVVKEGAERRSSTNGAFR
ncbi:MAG: CHAT domain-containing protein [Planctomycetaceae bacterium]